MGARQTPPFRGRTAGRTSKEKTAAGDIKSLAAAGKFGSLEKSGAAGLDAAVSYPPMHAADVTTVTPACVR